MSAGDNDFPHVVDLKAIETDLAASLAATLGAGSLSETAPIPPVYLGLRAKKGLGTRRPRVKKRTAAKKVLSGIVRIKPDRIVDVDIKSAVQKAVSGAFGKSGRLLAIGTADPLVEQALIDVIERVPVIVHARRKRMTQDNIDLLVDTFLRTEPTASARAAIEFDNARERARFREEVQCYTSREVAKLAGHSASNASATATRWKSARRIIGLPWKDGDLYPAFQFVDGHPRPVIAQILAVLPAAMTPWQIAFWLTSSNSWLEGATPTERLDDADVVLAAASHESEKLIG